MNFEVGHVNVSVKSEQETQAELEAIDWEKKGYAEDEGIAGCPWEDDKPVVGWHTDSYPFVCVLMLSDCTNMVGGETALQTGTGDILKVRGPQMVSTKAISLQDSQSDFHHRDAQWSSKVDTSPTRPSELSAPRNASLWSPPSAHDPLISQTTVS